jgi:hypothetical protein
MLSYVKVKLRFKVNWNKKALNFLKQKVQGRILTEQELPSFSGGCNPLFQLG